MCCRGACGATCGSMRWQRACRKRRATRRSVGRWVRRSLPEDAKVAGRAQMTRNPLTDISQFLTAATGDYMALGGWRFPLLALFFLLTAASLYLAICNWREDPAERSA